MKRWYCIYSDEKNPFVAFLWVACVEETVTFSEHLTSEKGACGIYINYALINAVFYYMVLCTFIYVYPVKDSYLLLLRMLLNYEVLLC